MTFYLQYVWQCIYNTIVQSLDGATTLVVISMAYLVKKILTWFFSHIFVSIGNASMQTKECSLQMWPCRHAYMAMSPRIFGYAFMRIWECFLTNWACLLLDVVMTPWRFLHAFTQMWQYFHTYMYVGMPPNRYLHASIIIDVCMPASKCGQCFQADVAMLHV